MAQVVAFKIEIDGVEQAIRNEQELAEAVKLVREEYKRSDYGTPQRKVAAQSLAQLKKLQADSRAELRDLQREYEITEDKGRDSYRALNAELVNLRRRYKELSRAERDVVGPQLLDRIGKLDTELKQLDAEMGNYQRNVGNYSSALGDLAGFDFAALATPAGAIAAGGAAALQATKYLKDMTEQVRRVRFEIETLSGATGEQLDEFTSRVLGISETFDVGANEVSRAANTLSKGLGISFESALGRIEDAYTAGLNINGEFIDSVREYPVFFSEAFGPGEAAANAFFEVIRRGNEQGIFNDKAVDAVKEVALRLRQLEQPTRDALEAIGLSSAEIAQQIEQEGVGSAIATVSGQLATLRRDSPEVGQALADIFGAAGEDAGLDFVLSLQDIDRATGKLTDTTNEYQRQQQETLSVNQEFARAQIEVAERIGGAGSSIENLVTKGKTLILQWLAPAIDLYKRLFGALQPIGDAIRRIAVAFGVVSPETDTATFLIESFYKAAELAIKPITTLITIVGKLANAYAFVVEKGRSFLEFIGIVGEKTEEQEKKTGRAGRQVRNMGKTALDTAARLKQLAKEKELAAKKAAELAKSTKDAGVAADEFARGSIGFLKKELSELNRELEGATGGEVEGILSRIIDTEAAIEKLQDARTEIRNRLTRVMEEVTQPLEDTRGNGVIDAILPSQQAIDERADDLAERMKRQQQRIQEAAKRSADRQVRIEEEKAARIAEINQTVFNTIRNVAGGLSNEVESRAEAEIAAIQDRYAAEIEAAEGNQERQRELEIEQAEAEERIRQEAFEQQKKYRVATALSSLAEGTVNILSAPTTIPDPFGAIFKGVRIAALAATTALQIGQIRRQRVAARGALIDGWVRGESHNGPSGGVSLMLNGQPVLAEAGEYVGTDEFGARAVVNRRGAAAHRDLLRQTHGVTFPGKRAMLSAINSYRGHGVSFAEFGGIFEPNLAGLASVSGLGGVTASRGLVLSSEDLAAIALAVETGSRSGTASGSSIANRRMEREERLRNRTG